MRQKSNSAEVPLPPWEVRRKADVRAVEAADAAYAAANGEPAPDLETLVEDGFLREAPPHVRVHDGVVTLEP